MKLIRLFKTATIILLFMIFILPDNALCQSSCDSPESSQFDFWVGSWDLTWEDSLKGTNEVTKELDSCVIMEHFDGHPSMELKGISVSVFDNRTGQWRQTWVDNNGSYLEFTGGMVDDAMILSRKAVREGREFLQRMIFYNIGDNEFDWDWMRSFDDGRTWESLWQIHYKRKI